MELSLSGGMQRVNLHMHFLEIRNRNIGWRIALRRHGTCLGAGQVLEMLRVHNFGLMPPLQQRFLGVQASPLPLAAQQYLYLPRCSRGASDYLFVSFCMFGFVARWLQLLAACGRCRSLLCPTRLRLCIDMLDVHFNSMFDVC